MEAAPAMGVTASRRAASPRPGRAGEAPPAGLLTAGDYDDLLNPAFYSHYVSTYLQSHQGQQPFVDVNRRLRVRVTDPQGRPAPFVRVELERSLGPNLILQTAANGQAVVFPRLDDLDAVMRIRLERPNADGPWREITAAEAQQGQVDLRIARPAAPVRALDLALVIDTTGSMGDELRFLQSELDSIVTEIRRSHPGVEVRVALVPYRDTTDDYTVRRIDFTGDIAAALARLSQQSAGGGGDYEEAMDQALSTAAGLSWRDDAVKVMLLVADAPPHDNDVRETWLSALQVRSRGVHIVSLAASGVGDRTEFLMRAMSAVTQARYLFLTDDSGVGDAHAEPEVKCYVVTRLDQSVQRVLASLISGRRVEPDPQDIIRTVGDYDRGRCNLPRR